MNDEMRCPKCGAGEEFLDFWIAGLAVEDKVWQWNCFECEYEWQVKPKEMKRSAD